MTGATQHKKPVPLSPAPGKSRRRCPVCGTVSYSRYGIHPQCAQRQAEAPRLEQLRAERKAAQLAQATAGPPAGHAWQKRCPQCQAQVANRKSICGCGYTFRRV
jgi:endogenous inhibitor of DNA gyrase (YacG/DUF329 family)